MRKKRIMITCVLTLVLSGCMNASREDLNQNFQSSVCVETTEMEGDTINNTTEITSENKTDENNGEKEMKLENIRINTQSSIRIEGSKIVYIDPICIGDFAGDADFILITHEHSDHFEPASITKLYNENTVILAPKSMEKQIVSLGIPEKNCKFLQPDESVEMGGIQITAVPAYNVNKSYHTQGKGWLGYLVQMDDICYYIAGDTDVNEDVKKVKCDIVFLPVGGTYTMDWKEAADYIVEMKPCKVVVPTHYGSIVGNVSDGMDFKKNVESRDGDIMVSLLLD